MRGFSPGSVTLPAIGSTMARDAGCHRVGRRLTLEAGNLVMTDVPAVLRVR
jgi:hypothetical protein